MISVGHSTSLNLKCDKKQIAVYERMKGKGF